MSIANNRLSKVCSQITSTAIFSPRGVIPPKHFPRAAKVDVDRYMGDWYVIAHIPPNSVKDSYNNVESYFRGEDDKIITIFTYKDGGFDGRSKKKTPDGFVVDGTNGAVWAMQFYWPLKMEYIINYVSEDYESTIVARSALDYVWIMHRQPQMPDNLYQDALSRVAELGYDMEKIRKVPQQPHLKRSDGR